jgi:hypothetical protein
MPANPTYRDAEPRTPKVNQTYFPALAGEPVPVPNATRIGDWRLETGTAREFRYFTGTERATATEPDGRPVRVTISGDQFRGGTVERFIWIDRNICLDAAAARAHAADVLAAAEEIEGLT